MAGSSRGAGAKMPGVSMKTSWLSPSVAMPRSGMRVVCTLWLTIDTLAPTSALTSVDLPALGAPITAMKPQRGLGRRLMLAVLVTHAVRLPHAFARQQRRGGGLLGRALGGALAARRLRSLMRTSEVKRGAWSGPCGSPQRTAGRCETLALRPFLQGRLGVGASALAGAARPGLPTVRRTAARAFS